MGFPYKTSGKLCLSLSLATFLVYTELISAVFPPDQETVSLKSGFLFSRNAENTTTIVFKNISLEPVRELMQSWTTQRVKIPQITQRKHKTVQDSGARNIFMKEADTYDTTLTDGRHQINNRLCACVE